MTVIRLVEGTDGVFMTPEDARREAWEHLARTVAGASISLSQLSGSTWRRMQMDAAVGASIIRPGPLVFRGPSV